MERLDVVLAAWALVVIAGTALAAFAVFWYQQPPPLPARQPAQGLRPHPARGPRHAAIGARPWRGGEHRPGHTPRHGLARGRWAAPLVGKLDERTMEVTRPVRP